MRFQLDTAEVFVPDGMPAEQALARTTCLCVGAHQDDIEIMAAHAILDCYQNQDSWFTGVVVTDGRGSPRNGRYENLRDEDMRLVRFKEQRKAAVVGEYGAQVFLDHPSSAVKAADNTTVLEDLVVLLKATQPQVVYTHNLADKHDTHVGVALDVIAALRRLPDIQRPKLYGCEVWRGLDWMLDRDKETFDASDQQNLQTALLAVHDSQISGGKRYDLATLARQRANATFFESRSVDKATHLSFAMDMTRLLTQSDLSPSDFMLALVRGFEQDVSDRLNRLGCK